MESSPFNAGLAADAHTCPPTADEATNASAKRVLPHLPQQPAHGHFPAITSHGLSPPQEFAHPHLSHAGDAASRYNHFQQTFGYHAVPTPARLNPPPTPPRQYDEYDMLRGWQAQQIMQERRARELAVQQDATMETSTASIPRGHASTFSLPQFSQGARHWDPNAVTSSIPQYTSYVAPNTHIQSLPNHQWAVQHQGLYGTQRQQIPAQLQQYVARGHDPRTQSH
jgi:hypothetical protein